MVKQWDNLNNLNKPLQSNAPEWLIFMYVLCLTNSYTMVIL